MKTLRQIRKIVIAVTGFTILLFGIVMILLPGTIIIIPFGLTILATEFVWAKRWLEKVKRTISNTTSSFRKIYGVSLPSQPQESCHHAEELSQ